jgi:hypothetical protein
VDVDVDVDDFDVGVGQGLIEQKAASKSDSSQRKATGVGSASE